MINTTPVARYLWAGLGGHFDSVAQVICEFVDNSVSNFQATKLQPRTVQITVDEVDDNSVNIQVEDTASGLDDLESVMRLGDISKRQTPLNEHGFGLKHALASADPSNNNWVIYTRTKADFEAGRFNKLAAPYDFSMSPEVVEKARARWPGVFNGSGTLIEFRCAKAFFNTIQRGIRGQAGFKRCLDYLAEELGYVYSGVIERGQASLSLVSAGANYNKAVESIKPSWVDYYPPGSGSAELDLGGGPLKIEYAFGEMRESSYAKFYRRNQSTSGVEIRINGRLMASNIFKDIWGLENHPSYNHVLATINLVSDKREALPRTRTSKNGIRSGDPKLESLYGWIRNTHPNPHKDLANALSERELVKELETLKDKQIRNKEKHIETEFKVFNTLGSPVPVDLYVFDGHETVIYEAKKDVADIQNVYQLLMYWDGAVEDKLSPAEGILLASSFSQGVDTILGVINATKDRSGRNYNLSKKTWADEGITYPK